MDVWKICYLVSSLLLMGCPSTTSRRLCARRYDHLVCNGVQFLGRVPKGITKVYIDDSLSIQSLSKLIRRSDLYVYVKGFKHCDMICQEEITHDKLHHKCLCMVSKLYTYSLN